MTTTISGTNGIDKVAPGAVERGDLPAGTVLQVVTATTTATTTTTSSSFVSTGLSASITPSSSSSKITVIVSGGDFDSGASATQGVLTIYRGATNLGTTTGFSTVYSAGTRIIVPNSMSLTDSPSSTSSTTYTVYIRSATSTTTAFNTLGSVATITLMEIAA